jgi:hypothetical protein
MAAIKPGLVMDLHGKHSNKARKMAPPHKLKIARLKSDVESFAKTGLGQL